VESPYPPDVLEEEDPYSAYLKPTPTKLSKDDEDFRARTLTDLSLGSSDVDLKNFEKDHENVTKYLVNLFTPGEGRSGKKFQVTVGSRGLLIRASNGTPLRAFYLEQIEQLVSKQLPNNVYILEIDFLRPRVGNSKPFGKLILMTKKAEKIKRDLVQAEERQLAEQRK